MFGFTKRPLFLIAWKNLKTYPVRIFLTTSSIILGVAVIIASNIFSESNKSAFDNLFTGIYEGVDLVVQPIQEDFAEGFSGDGGQGPISFEVKKIPDERIEEISNLPSVKAAWGEVLGFAQFIKIVDGETVLRKKYDKIVISPGPGNPDQAGNCIKIVKKVYKKINRLNLIN